MTDDEKYLRLGGWLPNANDWWHPPSCVAAFPIKQALAMARRDEERGIRMSPSGLVEYARDIGMENPDRYVRELKTGSENAGLVGAVTG